MTTDQNRDQEVRSLVDRAVKAAVDPSDMFERRIRPDSDYGWPEPRPRAGLVAALEVARIAQRKAHEYAKELRSEGASWADVTDLLGIPWSSEYARVERAYELVARDAGSSYSGELRLYWRCAGPGGCGEFVTDYGPYAGHPSDVENGHADRCARKLAEVTAWDRAEAERERREKVMDEAIEKVTDSFGRETVDRVRYVQTHGGRYLGWSTSEGLAVALVLRDGERLKEYGYSTQKAALDRVTSGMRRPPGRPTAWLRLLRLAATGAG
jgi:hypothetical protein